MVDSPIKEIGHKHKLVDDENCWRHYSSYQRSCEARFLTELLAEQFIVRIWIADARCQLIQPSCSKQTDLADGSKTSSPICFNLKQSCRCAKNLGVPD